ncbi:MAG: hypothetical protein Q9160_008315 [Pyrenula sp. 1 TL-2023]
MSPRIVLITGTNSSVDLALAETLICHTTAYHVIIAACSLSKAQTAQSEISAKKLNSVSRSPPSNSTSPTSSLLSRLPKISSPPSSAASTPRSTTPAGVASRDPDACTKFKMTMDIDAVDAAAVADVFRILLLQSANRYSVFVSSD